MALCLLILLVCLCLFLCLPVLVGWAHVSRCAVGPSGVVSWSPEPGVSLIWVVLLVIIKLWLLLVCPRVPLSLRLSGCEDWPQPQCTTSVRGFPPQSRICPNKVWCPTKPHFACASCGANWVVLCCLNPAPRCVVSEATWEGFQCRSMSATACDQPWTTS